MKALITILITALMLTACGQMQTNESSAADVLSSMNNNGDLSEEDLNGLDESLLNQNVQISQTKANSLLMKVGEAELLIDFINNLSGDPNATTMLINGIQVTQQLASDPQSFQGLITSLITAQLQKVEIKNVPAQQLVQLGLSLLSGQEPDEQQMSQLFGTLIRGALSMFNKNTPFSELFGSLIGGIPGAGQQPTTPQQPPANNNSSPVQSIIGTIGSALTGSNPVLGGFLSLILNLIK